MKNLLMWPPILQTFIENLRGIISQKPWIDKQPILYYDSYTKALSKANGLTPVFTSVQKTIAFHIKLSFAIGQLNRAIKFYLYCCMQVRTPFYFRKGRDEIVILSALETPMV